MPWPFLGARARERNNLRKLQRFERGKLCRLGEL
jgi:hypothetical protein